MQGLQGVATAGGVWGWGSSWVHSSVGILSSFLNLIKKVFLEQHYSLAFRIG